MTRDCASGRVIISSTARPNKCSLSTFHVTSLSKTFVAKPRLRGLSFSLDLFRAIEDVETASQRATD